MHQDRRMEKKEEVAEFWGSNPRVAAYAKLSTFVLEITAVLQHTAEVARTFSKVKANRTKLRNSLSVYVLQTSEYFPANFKVDEKVKVLHRNARPHYMSHFYEEE